MYIVIDTRQQAGKHEKKVAVFEAMNIRTVRSKLIVGDYARLDNQTVSVDTKKDIIEIAGNICGKQHQRFRAECERAKECGIQLIVLIEEIPPNGDLALWTPKKTRTGKPLTQVKGETLKKAMATMTERYGVIFEFTTREDCPRRIIEWLKKA